ncbi:MAG: hypothetical protein J5U17_10390 [Candidatus Methanoperedens sp.]|nr:hypothetical protein [Candidatus Methanoperedens sp.]MCE8428514.1 hypothetical protein [Candidatus Methanoperedens sp.]
MSIVAIISNTQKLIPDEMISQGGALATVSLILSLCIALLISDTKYCNKWVSNNLDFSSNTLLVLFAAIVASKIMAIL